MNSPETPRLTRDDVAHVANLARLTLTDDELDAFTGQLADVLDHAADLEALDLEARIARCVEIKAEVVAADERESGRRAVLNYGHTLGHALETTGGYGLRHGEAVAIGLVYAAELGRALGRIDDERVAEHRRIVTGYGLPGRIPDDAVDGELLAAMGRDKKAVDGLTFALDGPSGVEVVSGVDETLVADTLASAR